MKTTRTLVAAVLALAAAGSWAYPYVPDKALTPGAVSKDSRTKICQKDYTLRERSVSYSTREKVYRLHGVNKKACAKGCKIDHLVPLAIGGSNEMGNLWPHEYGAEWNVFAKTRLEVRLRKEVCSKRMPLAAAQECIRSDWTACFTRFYPAPK